MPEKIQSNFEIDAAFRISHKLGHGLAAKFSNAIAIQIDRFRGQYTGFQFIIMREYVSADEAGRQDVMLGRECNCALGYSDFHNLMGFTSKKMPNNIL